MKYLKSLRGSEWLELGFKTKRLGSEKLRKICKNAENICEISYAEKQNQPSLADLYIWIGSIISTCRSLTDSKQTRETLDNELNFLKKLRKADNRKELRREIAFILNSWIKPSLEESIKKVIEKREWIKPYVENSYGEYSEKKLREDKLKSIISKIKDFEDNKEKFKNVIKTHRFRRTKDNLRYEELRKLDSLGKLNSREGWEFMSLLHTFLQRKTEESEETTTENFLKMNSTTAIFKKAYDLDTSAFKEAIKNNIGSENFRFWWKTTNKGGLEEEYPFDPPEVNAPNIKYEWTKLLESWIKLRDYVKEDKFLVKPIPTDLNLAKKFIKNLGSRISYLEIEKEKIPGVSTETQIRAESFLRKHINEWKTTKEFQRRWPKNIRTCQRGLNAVWKLNDQVERKKEGRTYFYRWKK